MSEKPMFEPILVYNKEIDFKWATEEQLKKMDKRPESRIREDLVGIFYCPDNNENRLETADETNSYYITEKADGHVNLKPLDGEYLYLDILGAENLVTILTEKVIPWLQERENVAENLRQKAWDKLQEEKKKNKVDSEGKEFGFIPLAEGGELRDK